MISVVMPTYNSAEYLTEAINSILNQTYKDFEFIIIDDCSTDETPKLLTSFAKKDSRIQAHRNKRNMKMSYCLNLGISFAKGKYIARMDSDDWSYPYRLAKQLKVIESSENIGIVGGIMEVCDEKLNVKSTRSYDMHDRALKSKIFRQNPFSHPLIMLRKEALTKVRGYNMSFNPCEDYELYFRIGKFYKFVNLNIPLLKYRVRDNSMTTGSLEKMEMMTLLVRNTYKNDKYYSYGIQDAIINLTHKIVTSVTPVGLRYKVFLALRDKRRN